MNDAIRFGIIGTGNIAGGAHAPALAEADGVELWSVFSRDISRASEFARRHKAAAPRPAYDSLAEFLSDPLLQAVIVTSPDNMHAEHILACAHAGKHVLVEKPMTTSHADGLRAIEACRLKQVRLGVAFHLRWHAGHRKLHRLIVQEKALGDLRHIRVLWPWRGDPSNWRAGADMGRWWSLAGTGAHCLDLIRWFAQSPGRRLAERRSLIAKEVWRGPHDETAIVSFRFSDGATAESTTSVLFDAPTRLEIYGSEGHAICEATLGRKGTGQISLNGAAFDFAPVNPFVGEILDFAAAIREGRSPEVGGDEGLENVDDLLEAANGE
ncbi:MAG: Gfo/Idh/MocA family oxidoreductase [Alphaproteobacteria bacterium]